MSPPDPTPILRFIHIDNLHVYLRRRGIHAPNFTPNDGLVYRTNHNPDIQDQRRIQRVPCGPGGVVHDYASFYFGYLSPMMLQLKTGRVPGYNDGQDPLIYLVSAAQAVRDSGVGFVFSDGHGIAAFSRWFDDLADLERVDWDMVYQRYWTDSTDDMDRQRRKQAEFLVHEFCDWSLISEIAVIDERIKQRVRAVLAEYPQNLQRLVTVRRDWYYR
jgi:hypothetical protein